MKSKILIIVMVLFSAILGFESSFCQEFGKVSKEDLSMTSMPEDPEADAVILFDAGAISENSFAQHRRVKVFTKRGTEFANITLPFYQGQKIEDLEACTYTKDGKKHRLDKKEVFTKKVEEGWSVLVFSLPGVEEGCVFEYRYRKYPFNPFLESWYFQNEIFTKRSQFSLVLGYHFYGGFLYSYFFRNPISKNSEPIETDSISGKTYLWVLENIPPVKREPFVACINDYRTAIYLEPSGFEDMFWGKYETYATKTTWFEWGKFADNFFKRFDYDTSKVKKQASELTQGLTTDSAKTERIYDFVVKNIHWNEERGSFRCRKEDFKKILTKREGTATEINLLLLNLIKAIGIEANPVLISTRDHGKVLTEKPGLIQFNHMIVGAKLDDRYWFLDALDKHCTLGMLPHKDLGSYGLLLKGYESSLIKISPPHDYSLEHVTTKARMGEDGGLLCTTLVDLQGYISIYAREKIEKEGMSEFVKQEYLNNIPTASMDTITHTPIDSTDQPLNLNISFSVFSYTQLDGEEVHVNPTLFTVLESNPFNSETRQSAIDFPYTFTKIEDTELQIPSGFMVKELPANSYSQIPGMAFSRTFLVEGDRIKCCRQLIINQLSFPVEQYQKLRNFYQNVVSADQLVVSLVKAGK